MTSTPTPPAASKPITTTAKTAGSKAAHKKPSKRSTKPAQAASHCWPGFESVPGKQSGEKGSCKPKAHQTVAEKKADARAAAGSRLRKAGGNKAKANKS